MTTTLNLNEAMKMDKVKERRKIRAIARSRKTGRPMKKRVIDKSRIERLKRYNMRKLLFLKFSIDPVDSSITIW